MEEMKPTPPATREVDAKFLPLVALNPDTRIPRAETPIAECCGSVLMQPAYYARARQCVEACAGMDDPSSTLAAMREALETAQSKKRTACGVADELGVRLRAMREDLKTLAAEVQIHREPITDTGHHERWRKLKIAMTETDASGALTRAKENP